MVKKIFAGVTLSVVLLNIVYSQGGRSQPGIGWLSAGEYHPESVTPFSFAENAAVIKAEKGFSGSIYNEKRYMLEGLDLFAASAMFVLDKSAAGLALKYFGNPDYNEMSIAANYGRSLGKVNIGISVCYDILNINIIGKQSGIAVGVSSAWKLSENCYAVIQAKDIGFLQQKAPGKASQYKLGIGYRASSKINAGIEFLKEELRPPQCLLNIQYRFEEKYFARAGFISGSAELFIGAGWLFKNTRIEINARQHSQLGITPGILFIYQKKKK